MFKLPLIVFLASTTFFGGNFFLTLQKEPPRTTSKTAIRSLSFPEFQYIPTIIVCYRIPIKTEAVLKRDDATADNTQRFSYEYEDEDAASCPPYLRTERELSL